MSVGRRIRLFHARAVGEELDEALVAEEMELLGAAADGGACGGGGACGRSF
jgi:hypothetical protein